MRTCVIIPTYNEAKSIAGLVKEVRQREMDVLVIDDGSKDDTFSIAQSYGATVLRNQVNEGKGATLIKGFNFALDNNFDAVITMDGDGQHLPEDIPYFIRLARYSSSGIFIGNRMHKTRSMPWTRLLTNRIMSWLISRIVRQDIPDTQCGFRLFKKEVLQKVRLTTFKYETESEVLIRAARLGFKIESVPIKTVYNGEKSQINPFVDTFRFIRFILREIWTTNS